MSTPNMESVVLEAAEFIKTILLSNKATMQKKVRGAKEGEMSTVAAPAKPTDEDVAQATSVLMANAHLLLVANGAHEPFQVPDEGRGLVEKRNEARKEYERLNKELEAKYPNVLKNDEKNQAAQAVAGQLLNIVKGEPIPNSIRLALAKLVDMPKEEDTTGDKGGTAGGGTAE